MKERTIVGINDCSCLLVQDEREVALVELNAMEKSHKELQVLSSGSM
jgi:hypothetical protein